MPVINTNVNALLATNALTYNSRVQASAMQQLSTGSRINSAKDDAAGLAIGSKMTSQIRGLDMAVRNANDGISLLQTAEGASNTMTDMLQRMRELSVQASTDTNTADDRGNLDAEFTQLKTQITQIAAQTQWNGMNILNESSDLGSDISGEAGRNVQFQVGANANQTIDVTFKDFTFSVGTAGDTDTVFSGDASIGEIGIGSKEDSNAATAALDAALKAVSGERAKFGAVMNRLTYAADNLTNVAQNATESRSRVLDTDYAAATTKLAKAQIISQAATAMLAQANQQQQSVLALLK